MNSPLCFLRERDAVQNLASVVRTQQKLGTAGGSKVATCELLVTVFLLMEKLKSPEIGIWKMENCTAPASGIELHLLSAFLKESAVWWLLKHFQEGRFLVES